MISALPWIVGALGVLVLAGGVLFTVRVDERLWSRDNWCCRCGRFWHGIETRCSVCRGKGRKRPPPKKWTPAIDFVGELDTKPIPKIKLFEPTHEGS